MSTRFEADIRRKARYYTGFSGFVGWVSGGVEEDRTPDLRIANAALSQLSYDPTAGSQSSGKTLVDKSGREDAAALVQDHRVPLQRP